MGTAPANERSGHIAERIRHGIRRRRLASAERAVALDLPPALAAENRAAATDIDRDEDVELRQDVETAHELYELTQIDPTASPRPLVGRFITWFRRFAHGSLPLVLERQAEYNAATARSVSNLRNRSIRHGEIIEDVRDAVVNVLQPAMRQQEEALLALERVTRALQTDVKRFAPREAELDQLALVNRFRGSEESIRERQRPYLRRFSQRGAVLDVGCGRGEFLELLRDAGIPAHGVDSDPNMVDLCRSKGLRAERRDALAYLEELPPGSLGGIFAAQLIEHLELHDLIALVRLSFRALRDDGVLLVETPNPEALITFAEFYVDPTHVRPYHAETIRWLLESEGYASVDVEYSLQASSDSSPPEFDVSSPAQKRLADAVAHVYSLVCGFRTYAVMGVKPPSENRRAGS